MWYSLWFLVCHCLCFLHLSLHSSWQTSVKLSLSFPGCVSSLLSFCFHGNLFILPEFHCLFCVTCVHVNVICLWYGLWDRDHLWVYPLVLMEQRQMLRCVAWGEFLQIFMLCFNDKKQLHVSGSLFLWSRYRCIFLQETGTNTETHSWTVCREWETLKHPVLSGMSLSNLSSQGSGNFGQEDSKQM